MKPILKKVLGMSLASVISISIFTGCAGGKGESSGEGAKSTNTSAMGRYLEEEMKLPEGMSKIINMNTLADGGVRMLAADDQNKSVIWDSKDGGSTWTKVSSLPEEVEKKQSQIIASAVSSSGEMVITVMSSSDTGEASTDYWITDQNGTAAELKLELPKLSGQNVRTGESASDGESGTDGETFANGESGADGESSANGESVANGESAADGYMSFENAVSKFSYTDDGSLLGLDFENNIHVIDPNTGEITKSFSSVVKDGYVISFEAVGKILIVVTDTEVQLYNLDTGKQMEKDAALDEQLLKGKDETELMKMLGGAGEAFKFTKGKDDKSVFFCTNGGLYSHTIGGNLVEQVINGALTSMGNPKFSFISLAALEDGSFLAAGAEGYDTYRLFQYTYSKDTPSTPSKEVKVYSLEDNAQIRQAIAFFQKENPDIFVTMEVGTAGNDAVTVSDALRTLNTNIMSGKGPDILVLDGMPLQSYLEKGLLTDLTEITNKVENAEGLVQSIKNTYAEEDKIQAIPTRFKMPLLQGRKGDIENINDLSTMVEQIGKLKKENPDKGMLGNAEPGDLVEKLYASNSPAWLKEDGTLNEDALKDFYTQLKQIYDSDTHTDAEENAMAVGEDGKSSFYSINGGIGKLVGEENLLNVGLLSDFNQYVQVVSANQAMGDGAVKLLNGQTDNAFVPMATIGISSKSADIKTAGTFVEFLLSKEAQNINQGGGLPVNKAAFDEGIKTGSEGLLETVPYLTASGENKEFKVEQLSESDRKELNDMVESLTTPAVVDDVIKESIKEQAEQFVKGSITSDEAVKNVMQKINLYLAE